MLTIETKVEVTFSNNEKLILDENTIIFPITVMENNEEKFTSKTAHVVLKDCLDRNDGFIPELTKVFALNEFFTIDTDDPYETKVFKSSSIVSLRLFT